MPACAASLAVLVAASCAPSLPSRSGNVASGSGGLARASSGQLVGVALESGIDPGGLDADRLAFSDPQGAAVLSLGTGEVTRLPAPPRGLVFVPRGISGNIVVGDVSGALDLDPQASEALAYDIAAGDWIDLATSLPAGHQSSAIATDGTTIVGMDLGLPGGRGPARAYAFDVPSGTLTWLPDLRPGVAPVPTAVGGGHIVGDDGRPEGLGGWVLDQAGGGYTMLAGVSGTGRPLPAAVFGDTVVGTLVGKSAADDSPFVYDAAKTALADLHLPGYGGADVQDRLVLLPSQTGWSGLLRNLDTGASASLGGVLVGDTTVGVRPQWLSEGWVVGFTAPQTSAARHGAAVAIAIGEGP